MNEKLLARTSLAVSVVALLLVAFRAYPRKLDFDYMGIIFTALASLVAILLVSQVVNYAYMRDNTRRVVEEESARIAGDFSAALDGISMCLMRCAIFNSSELSASFYEIMNALERAVACRNDRLREIAVGYILSLAHHLISLRDEDSDCLLFPGKRQDYLDILSSVGGKYSAEISQFVASAKEETEKFSVFFGEGKNFLGIVVSGDTLRVKVGNPEKG